MANSMTYLKFLSVSSIALLLPNGLLSEHLFAAEQGVPAELFSGAARVIDGDTIEVDNQSIRLHGIDSPESGQDCVSATGKLYDCGTSSRHMLNSLITGDVRCAGTQRDNYNRLIAVCSSHGVDINGAMVLSGWSLAYRKYSLHYIEEEADAKAATRGLWSGTFEMPWDYRSNKWTTAAKDPNGCPIKGNINRKGVRIYHTPWSRSYAHTRINTSIGETWFCSEKEALAAGWRPPSR